jgi:hypothetical protein
MSTAISAYAVYTYTTGVQGMAGRIVDNGGSLPGALTVIPDLHTFLNNGDPKVEGFIDGNGKLRIAATDYVKGSQEPVFIYDAPSGVQVGNSVSWSEDNLYTLVKCGDFLYAIDYDNAKVIEINATTYLQTKRVYTLASSFNPDPSTYQAVGQELIVVNGVLYGLFAFPDMSWASYAPSLIVRFDLSGTNIAVASSNANLAKNAFAVASDGTSLYVAAIGGPQQSGTYNADSRLQSLPLSFVPSSIPANLLQPDDDNFPFEIRDITFKGSMAYVFAGKYDANWNMDGLLFSAPATDFDDRSDIDEPSGEPGYFWSVQYTADNNRLWYARGNPIRVYDAGSGTVPGLSVTLDMDTLKGSGSYDSLNDLTYVGAEPVERRASLRGYRSPLQRSKSPLAVALRAITNGRPEATAKEMAQARAMIGHK